MLKIEAASDTANQLRVTLSGNLLAEVLPELAHVVTNATMAGKFVSIDLSQVGVVDRSAVRFLASGEGQVVRLVGCPPYLSEWLKSEGRSSLEGTSQR